MNHKLELKDLQIKHFMEMNELKISQAWLFWLCSQQVVFLPIQSLIDFFSWFVSAWFWLPVY
jgi:hypothetical protein